MRSDLCGDILIILFGEKVNDVKNLSVYNFLNISTQVRSPYYQKVYTIKKNLVQVLVSSRHLKKTKEKFL